MQALGDIFTKVWPSARAMAADLGEAYGTVRKWRLRGRIPERVWPVLIRRTSRSGQPITAEQLLALNRARKKRAAD